MELHIFTKVFLLGVILPCGCAQTAELDNIRENSLRLVGAFGESAGRVEIYHDGIWGTVCDDGWGFYDAQVVCNQLGYPGAFSAVDGAYYGRGTGPIMLDDVYCNGRERYLANCRHDGWYDHNCDHSEDAGVMCYVPSIHYPRLINGFTYYEGRVEIWNGVRWTKICSNSSFGGREAFTVCKELGYSGLEYLVLDDRFGEGSAPPASWGYSCSEDDESLAECDQSLYTGSSCTALGLTCRNDVSLSGWAIIGIIIAVMSFVCFCVVTCVVFCKQSNARKSRRRNPPEISYIGGATNPAGPTAQYMTSPANQAPPDYNQIVSNPVYYPPVAFNLEEPPQYSPVAPPNNQAYPPPPNASSSVQQPS